MLKRKREIEGKESVCNIRIAYLLCCGRTPYFLIRMILLAPESKEEVVNFLVIARHLFVPGRTKLTT